MELYEDIYSKKFSFGKNWKNFLTKLNDEKIKLAEESLQKFMGVDRLNDKSFLDFGCGSGLFSLCALNLGAKKVVSVDIDDYSINCAKFLRDKFKISEDKWIIKKGSALDKKFIQLLGSFDIVYSWGVLHHTGNMWNALENIIIPTKKDGLLYIAIYNDFKGFPSSKTWNIIKKVYINSPNIIRFFFRIGLITQILFFRLIRLKNPIKYVKYYEKSSTSARGMDFFRDVEDWLGGYPYEYASSENIVNFYENKKNFILINVDKKKGIGCNEFLFKKNV